MDLNVANKIVVIFFIYRLPKANVNFFLDRVSEGHDFSSKIWRLMKILENLGVSHKKEVTWDTRFSFNRVLPWERYQIILKQD